MGFPTSNLKRSIIRVFSHVERQAHSPPPPACLAVSAWWSLLPFLSPQVPHATLLFIRGFFVSFRILIVYPPLCVLYIYFAPDEFDQRKLVWKKGKKKKHPPLDSLGHCRRQRLGMPPPPPQTLTVRVKTRIDQNRTICGHQAVDCWILLLVNANLRSVHSGFVERTGKKKKKRLRLCARACITLNSMI